MKDFKIGKKLYRSTALIEFKIIFLSIASWVLINLYFKTYSDPDFIAGGYNSFDDVVQFHMIYPAQFIGFIIGTLIPTLYYSFIRGIVFFETGVVINRGVPFFNQSVNYSDIESFKIVHPRFLISIKRKDIHEETLFTIRDVDRVVAIFDQHAIQADLGAVVDESRRSVSRKLILSFIIFGTVVSILQYTGVMIEINRYLFR
jgi:hypothetical protein